MNLHHKPPRDLPRIHQDKYERCPARCKGGLVSTGDLLKIVGHTDDQTTVLSHHAMATWEFCPTCGGSGQVRKVA